MKVAVIGGTGIDEMDGFISGSAVEVSTRFGKTDILTCRLNNSEVLFLPRHGRLHGVSPANINYRAQIAALKKIGADIVIGVCAVGSLTTDLTPGSFAVLTDFIDLTKRRIDTFFDNSDGPVVHTDFCQPYCHNVSSALVSACQEENVHYKADAVYVGVDGPRYETPAEIRLYASWGAHVIGMTNIPEVVLAREAGLCYGAIAVVTNLAAGLCPIPLAHDEVRAAMLTASEHLGHILAKALELISNHKECTCAANDKLVL